MEGAGLAGKILFTWRTLVLGLILLPSAFGVSLGISEMHKEVPGENLEEGRKLCKENGFSKDKTTFTYGSWGSFNMSSSRCSMLLKYNQRKADTFSVAATSALSRIRQAVSKQSARDTHNLGSWY